ncbi:cupin domain-containing protein [Deinococcus sonorensis]|uniref:Cupin domain-containing protein n=2 Tax=Deinococcus sonorensis TaxID=309891 RepID=A0AAU7UBW7_9DEIO
MTTSSGNSQTEQPLARGERVGLRMWQGEQPGTDKDTHASPYETVGYVLQGRAELTVNGQTQTLAEGDSYLVPAGAPHTYRILETFSALEATSPPAEQ